MHLKLDELIRAIKMRAMNSSILKTFLMRSFISSKNNPEDAQTSRGDDILHAMSILQKAPRARVKQSSVVRSA